jgi:predicted RNase H-like nuclease
MVGFPRRKRSLHKKRIQSWFNAVIHDGGIERFDELHVDVIDGTRKTKKSWIPAALESFELALEVRDEDVSGQDLTIILSFALVDDVRPLGVTFHDRESLEKNLSYSPPCILVYRKNDEYLKQLKSVENESVSGDSVLIKLNATELFGELRRPVICVYTENKRISDDEYLRLLLLIE